MPGQERSFGWQVGSVLMLLGAWRWGQARTGGIALLASGLLLVLAGVAAPRSLTRVQRAWVRIGRLLERVTRPLITALIYFVVVTPVGWMRRRVGRSPLDRDATAPSFWITPEEGATRDARRHEHPY